MIPRPLRTAFLKLDTNAHWTLLLNHSYGNVFENTRRKPFDYMEFVAEFNAGEKVGLDNVQIRGNLASWPLGSNEKKDHVLAITQYFDYMNNTAYEFGGQRISVTNGSVYNKGNFGSNADHYIQGAGLRLLIPVKGRLGVGVDAYLFNRNSHYELMDPAEGIDRKKDIDQRNPQVRVYLALNTVR